MRHLPSLMPLLLPLLLEAFFYFFSLFPGLENRLLRLPVFLRCILVALSAVLPLSLFQLLGGQPFGQLFLLFTLAVAVVSFWFCVVPAKPTADILLLSLLAALILGSWFQPLYPETSSGLRLGSLAKLLWLRLGISTFLYVRRFPVPGTGFWPNSKDWRIGFVYFLGFLAVLLPIGIGLEFLKFQTPNIASWQLPLLAIGWFAAILVFLAYGEEFFFRGVLQQVLTKEWGGRWLPLAVTSLLFGAVHLPFRNQFPNWRFAAVAGLAGIFYGLAFRHANSVRAAMVTHALTVTAWNMLFARSI